MRRLLVLLLLPAVAAAKPPAPPVAAKIPQVTELHGNKRVDDYFWLRQKGSPEVTRYLEAENAYTAAVMRPTEGLQKQLYKEMVGRIKETDISVPYREGGYFYYAKTQKGKQYPLYARRKGNLDGREEIILDQNQLAHGKKYLGLGGLRVSDDGGRLLYATDETGYFQFTLRVRDLATGVDGPEAIPKVTSSAWAKDGKTIFYVIEDHAKRPYRLYRHVLGSAQPDALVYEEKDERFRVWVSRSRSREYLFVHSASATTSEARVIPAASPETEPRLIAPRRQGREYYVDHRGDLFYIRDNSEGRRNFRVVTAPVADPAEAGWKELVAHDPAVMIDDIDLFADFYVLVGRRNGLPSLRVVAGETTGDIPFPEPSYGLEGERNAEFQTSQYRFRYSSPLTPPSVFDYDVKTGERKLLKEQPVLGGYDRSAYVVERTAARAADGTEIPLTLFHRKGVKLPAPLFLQGYGSYGYPWDADFDSSLLSLVDRGVVYAVAHIRGGGEMGKRWHDQGRMENKMNTFTDFVAAAEALVATGWTKPDRLVTSGASAGGLLMGAVTNLRPDLFRAVVAQVPFVDVINSMLDEKLNLTITEFEEWGNPKIPAEYDRMMRYSPYDNVAAKSYPAILVESSLNDSQCPYWEAAKWVAKLRALKTDQNPLLLHMRMQPAGHGGASGRYEKLREKAFTYAFIAWQLGLSR